MTRRYVIPSNVYFRSQGDQMMAINTETTNLVVYNFEEETGHAIIRHLLAGSTTAEILDCLVEEFDIDRKVLEIDLEDFLDELVQEGLLRADV